MKKLRLVLGDQLSLSISSLTDCNKSQDMVAMCEVWEEATYVKHHKKKIAFIFSAMRHFARELKKLGYRVLYSQLDDKKNTGSFRNEVKRLCQQYSFDEIIITHPGEYRLLVEFQSWSKDLGISVTIREDNRFLSTPEQFRVWAQGRKQLRMEYFYRDMRKQYAILMEGEEPIGGQWNFDADNRKPPQSGLNIPKTYQSRMDTITKEVITMVAKRFSDHFGDLTSFEFAVTRKQALRALQLFIKQRLQLFGDYQDAMIENEPWMYHSHISFYLNCGLLLPLECIQAAELAYQQGLVPLNAAEGFIRQIIGWREYVRGIYWLRMPKYSDENYLCAKRPLPNFYWTGETTMNCLHQCITETRDHAYAHHIQRLMVLGNFALIAGIDPKQVNEWYLIVYADAYQWVELPNVTGMILFADGGFLASKPYAASGAYINKMSNYCKNCYYKVSKKEGEDACPFNYLFWDFLVRNRSKLKFNHRLSMMYRTYDRMSIEKKKSIKNDSRHFLDALE